MHLAAESHVDRSITGPRLLSKPISLALMCFWKPPGLTGQRWMSKRKRSVFITFSTDEVYGDLPHPDEHPASTELSLFTETTAYAPSSPYSASKASSDHLVHAARFAHYGFSDHCHQLFK